MIGRGDELRRAPCSTAPPPNCSTRRAVRTPHSSGEAAAPHLGTPSGGLFFHGTHDNTAGNDATIGWTPDATSSVEISLSRMFASFSSLGRDAPQHSAVLRALQSIGYAIASRTATLSEPLSSDPDVRSGKDSFRYQID